VKDETFTLAPAAIEEAHPQLNGVSPGHSGVSGLRVTLMSRSKGSFPFTYYSRRMDRVAIRHPQN